MAEAAPPCLDLPVLAARHCCVNRRFNDCDSCSVRAADLSPSYRPSYYNQCTPPITTLPSTIGNDFPSLSPL